MSALVFRPKGGGPSTPCTWPAHANRWRSSGRYRMSILDYPVTTERGYQMLVCQRCRDTLTEDWAKAQQAGELCQSQPESVTAL